VAPNRGRAVDFVIRPFETTARELVPMIGAVTLIDLVTDFEQAGNLRPVGGYAGLVLEHYEFGDPADFLLGAGRPTPDDRTPLLGCECGEWGCWPLLARIRVADGKVVWDDFAQPHRPDRDYAGFGPFRFPEPDYRAAVADLRARLGLEGR
jgi:hypothetical protein